MGDFYDLALRRKVEIDRLRVQLAEKTAELLEADQRINELEDELGYVHRERDDAERQLDDVMVRPCSVCGVAAGDPCVTPLAYRMPKPHTTRNSQP